MKRALTEGEELTGNRHTYSVQGHLGEGGFAKAWVGETTTNHTYCLKHPNFDTSRMDDQTIQQYFNQERRILSDLQSAGGHPNVVEFVESFSVDGLPILVVELVDGRDGFRTVRADGPVTSETARSVGVDLSDAARFIHRNEHINRDLKPENFILTPDDRPVLVDFNTARGFDEDTDPEELDARFTEIPGRFKPPEVKTPDTVDFRQGPWSDVYSIGKILFYLVVGSVPKNKHALDVHEFNTGCPDDLAGIIQTATQADYQDRYHNAQELKLALEDRQPRPSASATLVRQETNERTQIAPGDTIGREASSSPATITVADPSNAGPDGRSAISSVQIEFDIDAAGNWLLKDRSLNGTWVHHGDARGWIRVLAEEGRQRLANKGQDPTLDDGSYPPTSLQIQDGDRIVLVHPTFDVSYIFHPD